MILLTASRRLEMPGTLRVHHIVPPLPRSILGKFHIFFSHARQLHLTTHLLAPKTPRYDVYFVDQLSTCIPLLRVFGKTRVVYYCHFPDKLLAKGAFVDGDSMDKHNNLLKRLYRYPMDWFEEVTTRQADIILANSKFTARVFRSSFRSIKKNPKIVYPGINISSYLADVDLNDPDIRTIASDFPTLVSLNRFEQKKNAGLALKSFAVLRSKLSHRLEYQRIRLVLAGGYDPRLEDNNVTLSSLIELAESLSLTYNIVTPSSANKRVKIPRLNLTTENPQVLFLLNFTTSQRTALLRGPSTKALLYTPANEHFGIGPVEGMACGVPVLACDSGGPTESLVDDPPDERTGWLRAPDADLWAEVLFEIVSMDGEERKRFSERAKMRARSVFGMEAMAERLEEALMEAAGLGRVQITVGVWIIVVVLGILAGYGVLHYCG